MGQTKPDERILDKEKYKTLCANCKHIWLRHHSYDDALERFVSLRGCEHWSGCSCVGWKEPENEPTKTT